MIVRRECRMKCLVLVLVFLAWFAATASGDFDAGMAASKRGDYATALREWKPLAEQGDAAAQAELGLMYYNGQGVRPDFKEAVRWFRSAAEQGKAVAQVEMGMMYYQGTGVPRDFKEAARWFRLGAEQGDAVAQSKLGVMYYRGRGVPHDHMLALMWFNLAVAHGKKSTTGIHDRLAATMTPAQVAEAQKLASEWKPKK